MNNYFFLSIRKINDLPLSSFCTFPVVIKSIPTYIFKEGAWYVVIGHFSYFSFSFGTNIQFYTSIIDISILKVNLLQFSTNC